MKRLSYSQLAEYVKQAQGGDMEAFAMLYAATVESQLYFATVFLKDSQMAEDVVQEVYLSVLKTIGHLKNPQYFVAYLNRICYNTCVDYKRNLNKSKNELYGEQISEYQDKNIAHSPDDRYMKLEQNHEIYRALAELPDHHRAAFLMRYYHTMRIREIAEAMECSESSVKRYIHAAVGSLRVSLQFLRP